MYDASVDAGVLRLASPGTRWLSTTWNGGFVDADAAYNVSVPDGFDRRDLGAYARERRQRAGFEDPGPTLLTGVAMQHARGATTGSVTCLATAGVSNPAALPVDPPAPHGRSPDVDQGPLGTGDDRDTQADETDTPGSGPGTGTVNLVVATTRALDDGALGTLLAAAVEAKTATLLARTGFTGTTTDAVVVGCDPAGEHTPFAGSGTEVGRATRAAVREAITAGLDARYADVDPPSSVAEADHGVTTTGDASVFDPNDGEL